MKRIVSLLVACVLLCQVALVLAESGTNWVCPNCQTSNSGNFCTECGEKKPSACPNCQASLPEGASFKFCPSCGSSLTSADQAPAPEAATTPEAPTAPATSAGLIDLMQQHQDTYINTLFLSPESYPEIILGLGYLTIGFDRNVDQGFNYVHIPCPDDAVPVRFEHDACSFINEKETIQYNYHMRERYAYEDFNAEVSDDLTVKDGSDGIAIHVIPEYGRAEALIGVPEMGKTAKLYLTIRDGGLSSRLSDQEKFDILSEIITAEVERISSSIQIKHHDQPWTYGRFSSLTMRHYDSSHDYYVFSDPEYIVTQVDDTRLDGFYIEGKNEQGIVRIKEVEINLTEYRGSDHWEEKSNTKILRHALGNGAEAITNFHISEGNVLSSRTEFLFGTGRSYSGEIPLFMEIYISYPYDFYPSSPDEAIAKHIEPLLSHMVIHHKGD